jgi:hypothetical protein
LNWTPAAASAPRLYAYNAPEVRLMHESLDNWSGIGLIIAGMTRQDWDMQLTAYAARDWRANFFPVGIAQWATHDKVGPQNLTEEIYCDPEVIPPQSFSATFAKSCPRSTMVVSSQASLSTYCTVSGNVE